LGNFFPASEKRDRHLEFQVDVIGEDSVASR
jgi:hypothetical protein